MALRLMQTWREDPDFEGGRSLGHRIPAMGQALALLCAACHDVCGVWGVEVTRAWAFLLIPQVDVGK